MRWEEKRSEESRRQEKTSLDKRLRSARFFRKSLSIWSSVYILFSTLLASAPPAHNFYSCVSQLYFPQSPQLYVFPSWFLSVVFVWGLVSIFNTGFFEWLVYPSVFAYTIGSKITQTERQLENGRPHALKKHYICGVMIWLGLSLSFYVFVFVFVFFTVFVFVFVFFTVFV